VYVLELKEWALRRPVRQKKKAFTLKTIKKVWLCVCARSGKGIRSLVKSAVARLQKEKKAVLGTKVEKEDPKKVRTKGGKMNRKEAERVLQKNWEKGLGRNDTRKVSSGDARGEKGERASGAYCAKVQSSPYGECYLLSTTTRGSPCGLA